MFYNEGDKTLGQVVQRGGECSVPGSSQGQAQQGSDQVENVPAHGRKVGLNDL